MYVKQNMSMIAKIFLFLSQVKFAWLASSYHKQKCILDNFKVTVRSVNIPQLFRDLKHISLEVHLRIRRYVAIILS